jgi:branched-chain amino acid transport system substrate-binding protein
MNTRIPMISTTFGIGNEQIVTKPEEHNGILASYAYFDSIDTPANVAFKKKYYARFGDKAPPPTELAAMTYHGFNLWAEGVKKAGTIDNLKVTEALESNLSYSGPAGKTTIDPPSHHDILDVYIGEAKDSKFNVLEKFAQQPPADTAAVCNLKEHPNENKQFIIDVKT